MVGTQYDRIASVQDLKTLSRKRLPKMISDFIDGGAGDEMTLRDNELDFQNWRIRPSVGVDVSERQLTTNILGFDAAAPIMVAPTGLAGLFRPRGEMLLAEAAANLNIPFCLSTNSVASIEQVANVNGSADKWFQIYMLKDKKLMYSMLDRAKASGYRVLCVTVDLATQGRRNRDIKNAFSVPFRPGLKDGINLISKPRWLYGALKNPINFGNFSSKRDGEITSVAQFVASLFDPSASWKEIGELISYWNGKTVIKGVLTCESALSARNIGANGIIVSNHGGRQLDQVKSPISVLPDIKNTIGSEMEIILDGGVRSGLDIVKAKALGATACMIGRPFLWGLTAGGRAGVEKAGSLFTEELNNAMALIGETKFSEISRNRVVRVSGA